MQIPVPREESPRTDATINSIDPHRLVNEISIIEQDSLYADKPTDKLPKTLPPVVLSLFHLLRRLFG